MKAKVIDNMIMVESTETLPDGVLVATVSCASYEDWKRLPSAISHNKLNFALSGWNSDRFVAYYRTDKYRCLAELLSL